MEKAGVMLIALGTNLSAQVFKHLSEQEIERLSAQILKMREIDSSVVERVVREFDLVTSSGVVGGAMGGKDFASQLLEQVVGHDKASKLLDKAAAEYRQPFESLWDVDPGRLCRVLAEEHPQVIAMVLTYVPPDKAAAVLSGLGVELQSEVARRICTMDEIDQDVMSAVEEAIKTKLADSTTQIVTTSGPKILVEILNNAERSTEKNVLGGLQEQDPAIGEQVRSMMFVFEDLPKLEDRTVQLVLREIDQEDLRLALKGASTEIRELVFRNMSERAAEMLKEDLELVGSVQPKDLEAAQQRVVMVVRRLLASGQATLTTNSDSDAQLEIVEGGNAEWDQMMKQFEETENGGSTGGGQSDESGDQVDMAA
jgi:flagellar motor switch protein FliG